MREPDPTELPDLDCRAAIHDLVIDFYREIILDDVLAPIFEEIAEIDWAAHIPLLIDYWCRILLGHQTYQNGALIDAHRHLHGQQPLTEKEFDRWFALWTDSIDTRYAGPFANSAKLHAARIGATLARVVAGLNWNPLPIIDAAHIDAPSDGAKPA